jgi:hypothetical protein
MVPAQRASYFGISSAIQPRRVAIGGFRNRLVPSFLHISPLMAATLSLVRSALELSRCRGRIPDASPERPGRSSIAQFFSCDPSRYFLSRSSAAWLPTESKAPFFERDTVTLPSDPTREKNLLNIL